MTRTIAIPTSLSLRTPERARLPRLGFLGTGWIGLNRLEAVARSEAGVIVGVADASSEMRARASAVAPNATCTDSLEHLLDLDLDGVVIATPSALHAAQSRTVLERGVAVFCQKPLGRTGTETAEVVAAACSADRLLGVDLSYRHLCGAQRIRELVQSGDLGRVYAVELAFHNAYGPDKDWFYNPKLSGGGCVVDLGIHLVDLALWTLGFPKVESVTSRLFTAGAPWSRAANKVEDFASARLDLEGGAAVQLACSWKLPAGRDAVIHATFYGTRAAARLENVNGSFYDFTAERFHGTTRETLTCGPEPWAGRAIVSWTRELAEKPNFNPEIESLVEVAQVLDRIYQ